MTEPLTSNESNDSTERYYADMEHARNYHEDEYFKARPQLLRSPEQKALFRAGFERAFQFLWQRFVDAEADMLRLHQELMAVKYPQDRSAVETEKEHG